MLEILANSIKTATREALWNRSDQFTDHDANLRHHEIRKREELHWQQAHAKWFRNG